MLLPGDDRQETGTDNKDLTMTMKFGVADPSNWYKQYHVVIDKEA